GTLARDVSKHSGTLVEDVKAAITHSRSQGRPASIDSFAKLFQAIPLPSIAHSYRDDASFARNFVAAPNPLIIERITKLDSRFPLTDEQLRSVMGPDASLAGFGASGRLFLADYRMLSGVPTGTYKGAPKFLYDPL